MEKKIKTYRFTEDIVKELQELVGRLNISETEAVARAIHYYYLSIVKDEETIKSNAIVSFEDYQKLQNQFSQALYRLGELEGSLKEKDKLIEEKERLINKEKEEKEKLYELLREKRNNKRFWEFWK